MPASGKSYDDKRDFRMTPEPRGEYGPLQVGDDSPIFVIQRHDASTERHDFRLEAAGVLKSWVVPKSLSTDPRPWTRPPIPAWPQVDTMLTVVSNTSNP